MATSISVKPPTNSLHHSHSLDDQDQYYSTTNDDTLCMEYLNEITTSQQSQTKDGVYRLHTDQLAPQARSATVTTKSNMSPYLQKLPHSNFIQTLLPPTSSARQQQRRQRRRRRRSSSVTRPRDELLDSAYQPSNVDHLDLSSFFGVSNRSFNRPTSAPTRTMTPSVKKKRVRTALHKSSSKGQVFLITVYRNGDHDKNCYCKTGSLNAILQYATEKLHMPLAARRLFDAHGQEIYRSEDIQSNQEYFVSSGENFKDPDKFIQIQSEYGLNSTWTLKGLQMDTDKPKSFKTKTVLSKRLDKQIKKSIHLTIIENGFGHDDAVSHMLIDSVLKENLEKFLEDCTKKLDLTAHARRVFNYRGDEIHSLKLFLKSDDCEMKTANNGIVYGPVWLSKGERFRPTGAYVFLEERCKELRLQLKKLRKQYRELTIIIKDKHKKKPANADETDDDGGGAYLSSTEGTDNEEEKTKTISSIQDKSLLSMTKKEMKELKKTLEEQIKEIKDLIEIYRKKMEEIEDVKEDEKTLGAKFAIEHIKEVKFEDKIVGRHPLGLIIHENGSYRRSDPTIYLNLRSLPSKTAPQTSIEYLLEYLQNSIEIYSRQRPKRVFDINGTELKILGHIKHKQHLFISYGEDFRPAFEPCLAVELHSVDVYEKDRQLFALKTSRPDDAVLGEKEQKSARQISALWRPVERIPVDVRRINYAADLDDIRRQEFDGRPLNDRINENMTFITRDNKLIYPELKINQRLVAEGKSKAAGGKPSKRVFSDIDLQTWCYDKDGYIYNKQLPSLFLSVIREQNIRITWKEGKLFRKTRTAENLDGYGVQLRNKTTEPADNQRWTFTNDGYIVSKADKNSALTSVATIIPEEDENFVAHGIRVNEGDPFISFAAVCPKCPSDSPFIYRQRWGIRQISGFTIGDWRYSKVENPLWHKMALTWPVDAAGDNIPDLQWPIEGCLIPGVPPIKPLKSMKTPVVVIPIRLQVLRNGERDFSKSVFVVGPDITNFILEPKASPSMYTRLHIPKPENEQRARRQIRRMADGRQREIKLFLEDCTTLCNLPFAGRRLFDIHGTEIFDLTSIKRDSYVYVTCGEQWIDPELTKAEQQRRLLLAYLSNDVRMIYFYCALRNPTEYAVETEQGLTENSRLILNKCTFNAQQRKRFKAGESIEQIIEHEDPVDTVAHEPEPKTAHERSHKAIDKKSAEKFRWPWEKIANKSLNMDDDDDAVVFDNDEQSLSDSFIPAADTLSLSQKTRKIPKSVSVTMQKFHWESPGGYISCTDDSNLVFGVKEIEGKVVEVILKRRNPDDIFQRWMFLPVNDDEQNGSQRDTPKSFFIVSKARPTMVLTVLLPSCTGNESSEVNISCVGCMVTLQQKRYEENGCANQKWMYEEPGFLFPFQSNTTDKEITAANRANICTYTVNYEALSQPGFVVSILNTSEQSEDVPVCLACAQAMRGKYRLVKIEPHIRFTCAIGKRLDLKFNGPFHCLNHKVDLTREEAENTLFQRRDQLEQLRQEASVRNIARELAAAKPIQIVRLLAYRNGDGHTKAGQLLIGSSILGILDQATYRLSLTNAARRLYVVDGTVILTIEDLIQWAMDFYKTRFTLLAKTNQQTALLDRVESSNALARKNPDAAQHRPSVDNQSEHTTFSAKLRDISPSKQRFQSAPKSSDLKRAIKPNSAKGGIDIDMEYLLKFPIEIWVSSGEPFVRPADANQRQNVRFNQREQRTPVEHDLEKEKHTLRLMKGRRISAQSPGELMAQQNPEIPVFKQGHWTQKTDEELDKQDDVQLLRTSLDELRLSQQPEITRPISSVAIDRLGQHSRMKRVMVYLNGEPKETAVQCFGNNLNELMENAKLKWNLMQPIQALFTEHGELIERFDQLTRDQLVCVSTTKTFITSSERQRDVDIKANWARTRNQYGDQATDIRVNSAISSFPQSVDPFGPPLLTLDDQHQLRPTSKPPTVPAPLYRRLAIEQPVAAPPRSTVVIEVAPSPIITRDSLMLSEDDDDDDDGPDSEIERITNIKEGENESSRPSTPRINERAESPFSQLFATRPAPAGNAPSTKKSDSDDDEDDEFIAMLKRK